MLQNLLCKTCNLWYFNVKVEKQYKEADCLLHYLITSELQILRF